MDLSWLGVSTAAEKPDSPCDSVYSTESGYHSDNHIFEFGIRVLGTNQQHHHHLQHHQQQQQQQQHLEHQQQQQQRTGKEIDKGEKKKS